MSLASLNALEVAIVGRVLQRHHVGEVSVVLLLEDLRVFAE